MANTNAKFGLRPIGKLGSNANSTGTTEYDILTGTTGSIFTGDPVKMVSTGGIAVAAAGDQLLGVFQGCKYTDSAGEVQYSSYWPTATASSDAVGFIVDDPDTLFEVQSAATGSVVQTVVGLNADIVYTAGSTTTGRSNVDLSGTMATGTAQCRIIGFSNDPENNALGTGSLSTYVNMIVKINEHFYAQTTGV
jgi:hypothetical protein|tara:strand:- start:1439 stop:2017 length:579 start_codon:yes stop_codon:yes gene_type:complete